MKNTGGSGRSKATKEKGSSKSAPPQTQNTNTVKSEGPPMKTVQPTAEQMALNNLIHSRDSSEDADLKNKIIQIMDLTGCTQDKAEIALFDSKNDMDRAVNALLEGNADDSEWRESGKKKKKQKTEAAPSPVENSVDMKPDKRDHRERNDRDNRDRNKEEKEDAEKPVRDSSESYRQRPRRNDNRPPRLSRGRGRPDRAGDRPERDSEGEKDEDNRDRGFERGERGRGRGRGFGRRARGGPGGQFRPRGGFDNKNSQFDSGPQIDTWTNETAVIGEIKTKITNWGDSKEDWNEDIDSWTGSLAESKVFTATGSAGPEPSNQMQMSDTNSLSNTFDLGALYQKHVNNDLSAEASYISQFNQQATESIKNSIGIGSGQSSNLQNSMSSQTASNVSALVSLQQNAMKENLGSSLNELTGNGLNGTGLTGTNLVDTSLVNSLSTSLPVNSLTSSALHSTSLSGDLTRNSLTSLSGTSLAGNSLTGTTVSGSGLTGSLTGSSLSAGSQSGLTGGIPTSGVSQNAMLQQRQKPQRSKLPPPSKIPASAVEMPGHVMTTLDVQFGNLEFGTDSSENTAFTFGGNESVVNAFSSSETKSSSTINDHIGSQVGPVPAMSKANEALISAALEQSSPRNSSLYQQSPYTTPTKQNSTESTNKISSPPEPLQMPGTTTELKSKQLNQNVSLTTTKIDTSLGSYSAGSGYQSSGYQSQKPSAPAGYQPSNKPGSYSGNQFQSASVQNQSSSSQFSSQYRQPSQNQYQSGGSQFAPVSQYQASQTGFQSSQTGYQSQSGYQSNQPQYQSNQNQYQNFQSGSTFQNQPSYSSNQSNQSGLYPSATTTTYGPSQSQQNSLYSQSSRAGSYSNQSYLNDHAAGAGASFQTAVTQSGSAFKENQSGASSFRDNVQPSVKSRDIQVEGSTYSRDTQSASSFSDSQSMAYSRDSQSVGSYNRDPSSSFKRDTKSASGSYPRDSSSSDSGSYSRDSQSASASYTSRDSQSSSSYRDRDTQSGAAGYGTQAGSYPRDNTGQSQSQTGYSAKTYRNSTEVTSLQSSLSGSKLVDSFSKMAVKDGNLESIQSTNSQFDSVTSTTKGTTNTTSLATSTTSAVVSSTGTTVISSTTTKTSTLPSAASTKATPNLPPGVPLMAQQYIMGQAGTLPFFGLQGLQGLQQPMYNLEDFQFLQQRMPPLATGNMYDLSATAAAAGLPLPPTTLTSNSSQQTIPTVPYTGASDSKLPRVDAQSPTGTVPSNTQTSATGQSAAHQQPYFHLNYGYYYPPVQIPGAGFQIPMIPMPQVTNATHAGTPANTQYQQKNYGSHVQYGTNKMYEDLTVAQTGGDFTKSPYGSSQTQPKANINSSVTVGSGGSSDIQITGYGAKTHAQAFDKQGFHAGTPPPFNLQLAAGQLTTGAQAGPLGAPTAAYGAPFVPMMTHQPHSQMMHHPLQDGTSSSRGSQQSGGHAQSKSASKPYTSPGWSYANIQ